MAEFDCEETKRHVHEYLHNELSDQELQDITAHLANCDSCEFAVAVGASATTSILIVAYP